MCQKLSLLVYYFVMFVPAGLWAKVHHKRGRPGLEVLPEEHCSQCWEWSRHARDHYGGV